MWGNNPFYFQHSIIPKLHLLTELNKKLEKVQKNWSSIEEWTTKFFNEHDVWKLTKLFWKLLKSPSTQRTCTAKWHSKMKISAPLPTTPKKNSVTILQLFKRFSKILIDWRFLAICQHWFGTLREKKLVTLISQCFSSYKGAKT